MEDIFRDKRPLRDIVIHEIWLETRMPKVIIEEIIMSEFKFLKHKAMPEYKNVWLQYFGLFGIKPNRLKALKSKKAKYICEQCGWQGNTLQHDIPEGNCPVCKQPMGETKDGIHPST